MAAGLLVVFVMLQMAFGFLFLTWAWILKIRGTRALDSNKREGLLWIAVISLTLAVGAEFYFLLGHNIGPHLRDLLLYASFSFACLGAILSLVGKGKGRVIMVIGCCGVAILWLPSILP
jgi:hypothetical protein